MLSGSGGSICSNRDKTRIIDNIRAIEATQCVVCFFIIKSP
jgi:hypothetical protein